MSGFRKKRISVLLREFLARELQGFGDPRFSYVTVTDIDVASDLKTAWVYWAEHLAIPTMDNPESSYADGSHRAQEIKNINEALSNAAMLLRKRVGQELKLRYSPVLHFKHDESVERGFRIDQILNNL